MVPSSQSVAATTLKSISPANVVSSSTISPTNTGIRAIRRKDNRFGTVRIRSEALDRECVIVPLSIVRARGPFPHPLAGIQASGSADRRRSCPTDELAPERPADVERRPRDERADAGQAPSDENGHPA